MKILSTTALAALICAGFTAPAFAAWNRIGSVDVNYRHDRDHAYTDFGGSIEKLQFRADRANVDCRFIRATFDNGHTRQIFSGRIARGSSQSVDLPGHDRHVKRLDFSCHADRRHGATVGIFADIGRYRDEWRRSPGWAGTWSRMFNWADNGRNNWDRIGSVDFGHRWGRDRAYTRFGGSAEKLQFRTANDSGVECRFIRATFRNGQTRNVFSGYIPRRSSQTVDLPGREREIRKIDFSCRSDRRDGVRVDIYADIGRYRNEWRRSPDWSRTWSRMFNWNDNNMNSWVMLGTESFEGRHDRETALGGWRGHNVDRIALKPDVDARCGRVRATFGDGQTRDLDLGRRDYLEAGRMHSIDLPGNRRDIVRLNLRCEAVHDHRVNIEIYARR